MTTRFRTLLFALLVCLSANAQDRSATAPKIVDVYRDWQWRGRMEHYDCDTLYYTANVEAWIIDSTMKRIAAQDRFPVTAWSTQEEKKVLELTRAERDQVLAELAKLKSFRWEQGLFPKSRRVEFSEIVAAFAVTERLPTEGARNMCSIIYTFTPPIFFRNDSLCLYLEQQRYRGNYTQLEYRIYRLQNGRWEQYAGVFKHYESAGN